MPDDITPTLHPHHTRKSTLNEVKWLTDILLCQILLYMEPKLLMIFYFAKVY